MRDLKFVAFSQENLPVNESASGAAITAQSLSMSKALEKPLNWFLAVALGSILALDKLGRSLDGTSSERSLEGKIVGRNEPGAKGTCTVRQSNELVIGQYFCNAAFKV